MDLYLLLTIILRLCLWIDALSSQSPYSSATRLSYPWRSSKIPSGQMKVYGVAVRLLLLEVAHLGVGHSLLDLSVIERSVRVLVRGICFITFSRDDLEGL